MQKIIILKGIPASGKSTYAKSLVAQYPNEYKRVNRDDLREMLDGYFLSDSNEKFVKKLRDIIIMEALLDQKNVIVDDTNLSDKNQKRIEDISREYFKKSGKKVEIEVKQFDIDVEEAIARDAQRIRPVGESNIKKMFRVLKGIKEDRGPNYCSQDPTLPPAIICDLDGTLAIINHRSPFDASRCEDDLLNEPIAAILATYKLKDDHIILLSGRTEEYMPQTKRWLEKYNIKYDKLLMRKTNDTRKDAIIKKEIVDTEIKDKYFIRFVLDDRNQVVDMWRKEVGYPCLQVNYGDF